MSLIKQNRMYDYDTTVLIFGFRISERNALKEIVCNHMAVFVADCWVDIIAVPYCIGIINFDQLRSEEQATIIEFFKSYGELTVVVYAVNYLMSKEDPPRCFIPCNGIFRNRYALKYNILTALKMQKRIGPVESVERRQH